MKEEAEAAPLHDQQQDIWGRAAACEDEAAPEPAAHPSEQEVGLKKNPQNDPFVIKTEGHGQRRHTKARTELQRAWNYG